MTIHSYVGSNTTIKGNLECSDNFLVEGAVEGNLNPDGAIVLGKDAVVRGDVRAREVCRLWHCRRHDQMLRRAGDLRISQNHWYNSSAGSENGAGGANKWQGAHVW